LKQYIFGKNKAAILSYSVEFCTVSFYLWSVS